MCECHRRNGIYLCRLESWRRARPGPLITPAVIQHAIGYLTRVGCQREAELARVSGARGTSPRG